MKKLNKLKLKIASFISLLSIALLTLFSAKTYAYTYNPTLIDSNSKYGLFYYVSDIEFTCKRNINNSIHTYFYDFSLSQLLYYNIVDSTYTEINFNNLANYAILGSIGFNEPVDTFGILQSCYDFNVFINFSTSPNSLPIWSFNFYLNGVNLPNFEIDSDMGTFYSSSVWNTYPYFYFDWQYINNYIYDNLIDIYSDNNILYFELLLMDLGTYESLNFGYMFSTYQQAWSYIIDNGDRFQDDLLWTISELRNQNSSYENQISLLERTVEEQSRQIRDLQDYEFSFPNLIWTIASTPFESFKQIWNVDFLGLNIANFVIGLLSALIFIYILKKVL